MDFQQVTLHLPEPIERLANTIESIEPNSCLAGGFLSDLYMGTASRDVDFFISCDKQSGVDFTEELKRFGIHLEDVKETSHYYPNIDLYKSVLSASYEGYALNFFFQLNALEAVHHFDIRFREFYHLNGQSYASKEALSDIEERQLCAGVIYRPVATMHRLYQFQDRYDFSINETYLEPVVHLYLKEFESAKHITPIVMDSHYDGTRKRVTDFFTSVDDRFSRDKIKKPEFLDSVAYGYYTLKNGNPLSRKDYHSIFFHTECVEEIIQIEVSRAFRLRRTKEQVQEIRDEFKRQRMRFMLDHPEDAREFMANSEDDHYFHCLFIPRVMNIAMDGNYATTLINSRSTNDHPYLSKLFKMVVDFQSFIARNHEDKDKMSFHFSSDYLFPFSSSDLFSCPPISAADYLSGRYVTLNIVGITGGIWDREKRILQTGSLSALPSDYEPFFEEAIHLLDSKYLYPKTPI